MGVATHGLIVIHRSCRLTKPGSVDKDLLTTIQSLEKHVSLILTSLKYSCASELSSAKAQSGCRVLQQVLSLRLVAWQVGTCSQCPGLYCPTQGAVV